MSTQPPFDNGDLGAAPPDDDVLAGELVLGVLSAEERRAAQARAESDPQFAARVALWERHVAPWLAEVAPVTASAQVWPRICERLGWQSAAPRTGLWQNVLLWRSVAALAVLAAVALWVTRVPPTPPPVAAVPPSPEATAAKPVTALARPDGTTAWLASIDAARGTVLMVPVPSAPDTQGRVAELWIIPAGQAPRSLGQVSTSKSHTVSVPSKDRAVLVPGSVLAITLEPAAGIPHAAPSGPIVAKGAVVT